MKNSKYTKELLEESVKKVTSLSDLVRLLLNKDKAHGSMTSYIKAKLIEYNIDFTHFKGAQGRRKTSSKNSLDYIYENYLCNPPKLKVGSSRLKQWLFDHNVLNKKCSICGLGDEWNNKKLSLQLDHIDGNSLNNELKNLRILCPNCHSQTDTFTGKNRKQSVNTVL